MISSSLTVEFDSKPKEKFPKLSEIEDFFTHSTSKFPEISREIEKFPGNKREVNFTGNSREFPGGKFPGIPGREFPGDSPRENTWSTTGRELGLKVHKGEKSQD